MSFANLIFLFGAIAVIGPLVAHLWANPRFRRVPFTMIRFLQIGQQKNQSRQSLKNLLILLLRCLIIVLLAMLFAGPKLSTQARAVKHGSAHYLALDDSLSMAYRNGAESYFDIMIERTRQYLASAPTNDSFTLYALASGKTLTDAGKHEADLFLRKLAVHPGEARLIEFMDGLRNAQAAARRPEKIYAYLASDFTPRMMAALDRLDVVVPVDEMRHERIAADGVVDNMAITDARAVRETEGTLQMNITVSNFSPSDRQNRLNVLLEGKVLNEIAIELKGYQERTFIVDDLPIPDRSDRWLPIELQLDAPDGLHEDNTFYLPVFIPRKQTLRVLAVGKDRREMFLLTTALETLAQMDARQTITVTPLLFSQFNPTNLNDADVLIFTNVCVSLEKMVKDLQDFVYGGGRIIFFAKDFPAGTMDIYLQAGILPVLPRTVHSQDIRLETGPSSIHSALESTFACRSLPNYRMDRIVFKGYFNYQPSDDSICTWRFENQTGFVYLKSHGNGKTVWVNTSTDDSLGMLMKSPAAVPFCRYLLGPTIHLIENKTTIGEPILFPLREIQDRYVDILSPGGKRLQAIGSISSAVLNYTDEIGFFRTATPSVCYAGVNPPASETDMTPIDNETLKPILEQRFPLKSEQESAAETTLDDFQNKPLRSTFAWILIVLITAEAFITNRMQR